MTAASQLLLQLTKTGQRGPKVGQLADDVSDGRVGGGANMAVLLHDLVQHGLSFQPLSGGLLLGLLDHLRGAGMGLQFNVGQLALHIGIGFSLGLEFFHLGAQLLDLGLQWRQLVHPGVGGVSLPPQGQGKRAQPALVGKPPQLVPDALCQGGGVPPLLLSSQLEDVIEIIDLAGRKTLYTIQTGREPSALIICR